MYGPIPIGHEIHHKDSNHSNNHIDNLQCVTVEEHFNLHLEMGQYLSCALMLNRLELSNEDRVELRKKLQENAIARNKKGLSAASIEKMKNTLKGRKQTPEWIEKRTKGLVGKPRLQTTKEKLSEKRKGLKWYNNGSKCIMSKERPDGWYEGRIKRENKNGC
jgi:hypothetical protein